MSLPTFQEMWSRYLFNNKVPKIGDGLLDESLITLNTFDDEGTTFIKRETLEISASEFMQEGNPGSFINGANFSVVNNFFSGELLNTATHH